ncbi:MAG: glycosyltransferase [Candidatus Nezhaarchaeales archaeon]
MRIERTKILIIFANLLLLTLCLTALAYVINSGFLGLSLWEALSILSVPIIIEAPQTLGRAVLLPLLEAYRLLKEKGGSKSPLAAYPKVSVIVPAHNEEEYIQKALESLLEDTYPNKEIIVVDDGSTDKTYVKAIAFAKDPRVKVVRREVASGAKARAVNYGLIFASGDIITVVDGDTIIERGSLRELVAPMLRDPNVIGVAGNVKVANRKNLLTRFQAYEYLLSMEMGRRWQGVLGGILVIPGAFGAVRRDVFESLGRMHPDTITEDFDMTLMLQKVRKKIAFSPRAIAWTHVPERWRDWIRQRRRWASGQAQVYLKHSNIFFRRRFGLLGFLIAPNNVFMDMVALFIRYLWLAALLTFYVASLSYLLKILLLVYTFYFALELTQLASASLLTPVKKDLENAYLAPLMMLYRSIHSIVRLTAYMDVLLGKKIRW